jgi:rare lipoprotein A
MHQMIGVVGRGGGLLLTMMTMVALQLVACSSAAPPPQRANLAARPNSGPSTRGRKPARKAPRKPATTTVNVASVANQQAPDAGTPPGELADETAPADINRPTAGDADTNDDSAQPLAVEEGIASWYGSDWHGKATASGERFNKRAMTAAHKTLPLGAKIRVVNLKNGNAVVVRINDRGPYTRGRIVDVSEVAAEKLDIIDAGVCKARVEVLWLPPPKRKK